MSAKLEKHRGRFTTLNVYRKRDGLTSYCAKIISVTPNTVRFFSVNEKKVRVAPLKNLR
jgi:hypothetical protein